MTEALLKLHSPSQVKHIVKNEVTAVKIPPAEVFHSKQYRWNTSEEIYAMLTATSRHAGWLSTTTHTLPSNGTMILYDRDTEGLNYRRDGYIWKKRKDGKHTREDHMRLRVKGADMVNGYYTHSAILSSFHRRSYNLPSRPNIMLVHYLNAPVEGREPPVPTLKNCDKRVWDREELAQQIFPMYNMPTDLISTRFVPPSHATVNRVIDDLLATQTNEDGVQVTAQWVLSLGNNGSYLVQAQPQTPTFQIPNNSVQLLLAPINATSVIQTTPGARGSSVGLVKVANHVPIAAADHFICDNTSSQTALPQAALSQPLMPQPATNQTVEPPSEQIYIPSLGSSSHLATTPTQSMYQTNLNINNESQSSYLLNSTQTTPNHTVNQTTSTPNHTHLQPINSQQCSLTALEQQAAYTSLNRDLEELQGLPMDITTSHQTTVDTMSDVTTPIDIYHMTAEEISSTLVANMPQSCSPANAGDLAHDLQLDSNFDLFAELNVNEDISQSTFTSDVSGGFDLTERKVTLTALAPEWSYADGGCKVLLVGPWKAGESTGGDTHYTCMFGDKSVKAELVQDGVLSCITPAHEHGKVHVRVAYCGKIISESCLFEFRDRKSELSRHRSWFVCEESRLQMALVDRLEMVKCRLDILFPAPVLGDHMNLEQRVTALLLAVKRYKWRSKDALPKTSYKGLTLFHLAAALGYRSLLDTLNSWREESPCELLCNEVSTRTKDNNGCIALHWACALGRMETTLVMYYMDRVSLDEVNSDGMTPLSLARAFKNKHIVEMLVQQEHSVLESKLDSQGLNKCSPSLNLSKHCLRRSASPVRRSSPVRHPPVTRHNSTPNSMHLPSPFSSYHDSAVCSTPEHQHLPPLCGENSELDDEDSIVDVEALSDNESSGVIEQDRDNSRIRTLAEHIIAAIPERIKFSASDDSSSVALLSYRERSSSRSSYSSTPSCAEDSGVCTPLTGDWVEEWNRSRLSSSPCFSVDSLYRTAGQSHSSTFYPSCFHPSFGSSGLSTNYHTTSAASSTSYNTGRSDSPPPSAQILGEYFNAGEGVEYGLSQLTLSDTEQRKLYQAAQVIQHAFRQFKDKKQQQREIEAAVIIQTYYRRFKEFTTLRHIQKQQAATRIQSQFRSYYAQKRFKKSRDAALLIQHHYRAYKEHEHFKRSRNAAVLIQQKFRTHYNRKKCSKQSAQDVSCPYRSARSWMQRRRMYAEQTSCTSKAS